MRLGPARATHDTVAFLSPFPHQRAPERLLLLSEGLRNRAATLLDDATSGAAGPPGRSPAGPREIAAAAALAGVLALGWVTDYSYLTQRTSNGHWSHVAASWLAACQRGRTGELAVPSWGTRPAVTVSCSRIRR